MGETISGVVQVQTEDRDLQLLQVIDELGRGMEAEAKAKWAFVWDAAEFAGQSEDDVRRWLDSPTGLDWVAGCRCGCRGDLSLTQAALDLIYEWGVHPDDLGF